MNNNNNKKKNKKPSLQPRHWTSKHHITKFKVDRDFVAKKIMKTSQEDLKNKRSCDYCRQRKVKCELVLQNQCSHCRKVGIQCQFQVKPKKAGPPKKQYLESLEKQVQELKQLLKEEQDKNEQLLALKTISMDTTSHNSSDSQQEQEQNQHDSLSSSIKSSAQINASLLQQQQQQQPIPQLSQQHTELQYTTKELIKEIPGLTLELTERLIIK